jgi:hypothetical protein
MHPNSWQSADGSLFEKLDAMMEAERAYFSAEPSLSASIWNHPANADDTSGLAQRDLR